MTEAARWMRLVGMAVGAGVLLVGCGQKPSSQTGAPRSAGAKSAAATEKIYALVPCGQVGPFSKIVRLFQAAHPQVRLDWEQENIVTMTKKVLDGKARPDAFLSMGDLEMNQLQKAGLIMEGTRQKVAENSLAIVVPAANPGKVSGIADFAKPSVKLVAVPDPEVNSVGRHTQEALKKVGIWSQVQRKILLPRFAADSKDLAIAGKVEAAIAYYPCSVEVHVPNAPPTLPKSLKLVGHIPSDLYAPFWCEGAVIKGCKNPQGGKLLLEFLQTPEVQRIYRDWEFVREPGKPAGAAEKG